MKVIEVRNVHEALPEGLSLLTQWGTKRASRYGDVLVSEVPVTTHYLKPRERVLFWKDRDANPFFHLFESLHMLAGRDDVAFLSQFAKRMETFSDDGKTFHGAYGKRWVSWFGIDQIQQVIGMLRANPLERRCVIQMWDTNKDLGRAGKDFPCNTQIYVWISPSDTLDMTVCNRSNDIIWGAYGANAVHMSILQEYIAAGVERPVGSYWQMSNNFHAYLDTFEPLQCLANSAKDPFRHESNCPYTTGFVTVTDIVDLDIKTWTEDLHLWMDDPTKVGLRSQFFKRVATPLFMAHRAHKSGDTVAALDIVNSQCLEGDWKVACIEWLERRVKQ